MEAETEAERQWFLCLFHHTEEWDPVQRKLSSGSGNGRDDNGQHPGIELDFSQHT